MSNNLDSLRYIIVGAGQAGAETAMSLRKHGFDGRITLIGEEVQLPYRRPPLSKAYFSGDVTEDSLYVAKPAMLEKNAVEFIGGSRVEEIDRDRKQVILSDASRLAYDKLAITTGGRARPLTCPGSALEGVYLLRTLADVGRIRARLNSCDRMVIVGGGFIGLEVAASARKLGIDVTVVETMGRVLARVTAPVVSSFFERIHGEAGVVLRMGASVKAFEGDGHVETVVLEHGEEISADIVIVGIGLIANTELAEAAGLSCDNGILVDEFARTRDADIVAAGDCANHPNRFASGRTRLESVQNALDQSRVAAASMLGKSVPYDSVPWFWSDQYDCKLQMAGLSGMYDEIVLRGDPNTGRQFAAFYLREGVLIAADCVNRPQDFMFAKKLVAAGAKPDKALLADLDKSLKAL